MSIPSHLQAAPATTKEGISLNKEGVASPAEIKIRSVKEGGKANPKRLQLITLSSPSSKDKKPADNTSALGVENAFEKLLGALGHLLGGGCCRGFLALAGCNGR